MKMAVFKDIEGKRMAVNPTDITLAEIEHEGSLHTLVCSDRNPSHKVILHRSIKFDDARAILDAALNWEPGDDDSSSQKQHQSQTVEVG